MVLEEEEKKKCSENFFLRNYTCKLPQYGKGKQLSPRSAESRLQDKPKGEKRQDTY